MDEFLIYGIGGLLICFTVATFLLNRIDVDIIPEEYEFKLDPFWYLASIMLVGGLTVYTLFPTLDDVISSYNYFNIAAPIVFAAIIYFCYVLDIDWLAHVLTLGGAYLMVAIMPDEFRLFPEQCALWQEQLILTLILFTVSKGFGLLNGLGGIASMQFIAIVICMVILVYFNALPQILGILALTYGGVMIAFAFFSWPPEKMLMSDGAFSAFGFIIGCLMLNGVAEYAEAPLFISVSYLFTETGLTLYRRYIERMPCIRGFMCTSYFLISDDGKYEQSVARGILKILVVDIVLSIIQIAATERLAFPVFAMVLNLWLLSILSGDTKPEELLSISKWGKNAIKGMLANKKNNKKNAKNN